MALAYTNSPGQQWRPGMTSVADVETVTSGTASGTYNTISVTKTVSIIPTSTEATYVQNFRLAVATTIADGTEKYVVATATGNAQLTVGTDNAGGTATSVYVMGSSATDYLHFRFFNGAWYVVYNSGATFATNATA